MGDDRLRGTIQVDFLVTTFQVVLSVQLECLEVALN